MNLITKEAFTVFRTVPEGEIEKMDYLELIARSTSHIHDKGQVMVRCYGLYVNAHWGKASKLEGRLRR